MIKQLHFLEMSSARLIASIFGVLAGIGGIMHGPGEILQGNVTPDGIFINSWTLEPIATNVGGEPAMTIIPNLLLSGVLTILVSLSVLIWAAFFIEKRHGGLVLIILSFLMLLVGSGFAPPLVGLFAGISGLGINGSVPRWYASLPEKIRKGLVTIWPWLFVVCVLDGVILILGALIFAYIFGLNIPSVWVFCFLTLMPLLLFTIITGVARDIQIGKVK